MEPCEMDSNKLFSFCTKKISTIVVAIGWLGCCNTLSYATTLAYEFHGIQGEALKNAQAALTIQHDSQLKPLSLMQNYQQAPDKIRLALEPYGYFRPKIYSQLVRNGPRWLAILRINPGPQLTVTDIAIHLSGPGKYNNAINHFVMPFPIKQFDAFNAKDYENAKSKLFNIARNQGYLNATFDNQILIDRQKYQCHIRITLSTGTQFYFGPVTYMTHPYSTRFLDRIIKFNHDEPFSSYKLIKLQQAMENSYYFRQVIITPDLEKTTNQQVPIAVYMAPHKAKKYNFGIGYGTLTGARLTAGLSLRHLGNNGHHFESELKLSTILSGIAATYYIPGNDPLTEQWLIGTNYKTFKPKSGRSESITLTGGYDKKINKTQLNLNLNFSSEKYTIFAIPNSPIQHAHLLYPNFRISYINTNNLMMPKNGIGVNFNLQGAAQPLLSSTSFIQPQIKAKYIASPFNFAQIILKGDVGYTVVSDLYHYPLSMRFFAGGINSIRGFADSSIGPGRYLTVASIEYRNKIVNPWQAALFYDVGTASNQFGTPLNRGAGIGIIYQSIIGPIKLYGAQALSKATHPFSLEFMIGPEFA